LDCEIVIKDLNKVFSKRFIKQLDKHYGHGGANNAANQV